MNMSFQHQYFSLMLPGLEVSQRNSVSTWLYSHFMSECIRVPNVSIFFLPLVAYCIVFHSTCKPIYRSNDCKIRLSKSNGKGKVQKDHWKKITSSGYWQWKVQICYFGQKLEDKRLSLFVCFYNKVCKFFTNAITSSLL